jgi:hypothetical protein
MPLGAGACMGAGASVALSIIRLDLTAHGGFGTWFACPSGRTSWRQPMGTEQTASSARTMEGSAPQHAVTAHAESKLHVVALAVALVRRWLDVLGNAVDPGRARTRRGGASAPVSIDTGQRTRSWLAISKDPAAMVSGHYWYPQRQRQPARDAMDVTYQDQRIDKLGELTGVTP